MEYRNLGESGLQVSVAGLGCNNFGRRIDKAKTADVVAAALDLGVTLFDTADVYGPGGQSEEFLGAALGKRRADVIIATKFANPMGEGPLLRGASRRYIFSAVEASLRRLNTDWIDLYQVHIPDAHTPPEETMRALDDLVRAGKVRYIGCSNYSGWQIADAQWTARAHHLTPFVSAQNQYSLLDRRIEREVVPAARRFGLSILPWGPLASGFLSGKYRPGEPPPAGTRLAAAGPMAERALNAENFAVLEKLESFAALRGRTVLDVAIGWLATKPWIASVINGATSPGQMEQNVRAADYRLTPEEMAELDQITRR
ncbi:MAG TPA: aldo/keto reductase [Dehalococcoidia bacterium]|nr:aldo/keto reductase [Dehalococcoidia bacterium]